MAALPRAAFAAGAAAPHGYALIGNLAYPAGFDHFAYVNAAAPKGGSLRQVRIGAFDSLNTLDYPANPPADLRLIYDRLFVESDDEVASYYGVLAETIAVAPDYSTVSVTLRPEARWHDGTPVTPADVVFTFERLKAGGAPYYRQAFRPLTVTADGERGVLFRSNRPGDRDVIRRIATIPIHPAAAWEAGVPALPLGSGPYRLEAAEAPRRLVLSRVADYWGRDLGVNRGRYNFDTLVFEHYRDATVAFEAFKAGEADVRVEDDPTRWASGYDTLLASGEVERAEARTDSVGALYGLVFNLRRPDLADRRVRLALTLAYDFEAANALLFRGAYERFASVFAASPLAAEGAASAAERQILAAVPEGDPMLASPDPLAGLPDPGSREALAMASRLLDEAGYKVANGVRTRPDGSPLAFKVLATGPQYDAPLAWLGRQLARIGVRLEEVRGDTATISSMMLGREFDLATLSWSPARLPGTAERLLWHSALAEMPHSYALSGLRSGAVDAAIEALESARDEDHLATAGRAFDRAFRQNLPMLPLWRVGKVWIAWRPDVARPDAEAGGMPPSPIDRWWATTGATKS